MAYHVHCVSTHVLLAPWACGTNVRLGERCGPPCMVDSTIFKMWLEVWPKSVNNQEH